MSIPDLIPPGMAVDSSFWMKAAQAALRRFCGWHVAPSVEQTFILNGTAGRTILLPSQFVTEKISVLIDGRDVTDRAVISSQGIVQLEGDRWPTGLASVKITVKHGFELEDVPDVQAVLLTAARRAASGADRRILSQAVGGASVSYRPQVTFLGPEQADLAPYIIERV